MYGCDVTRKVYADPSRTRASEGLHVQTNHDITVSTIDARWAGDDPLLLLSRLREKEMLACLSELQSEMLARARGSIDGGRRGRADSNSSSAAGGATTNTTVGAGCARSSLGGGFHEDGGAGLRGRGGQDLMSRDLTGGASAPSALPWSSPSTCSVVLSPPNSGPPSLVSPEEMPWRVEQGLSLPASRNSLASEVPPLSEAAGAPRQRKSSPATLMSSDQHQLLGARRCCDHDAPHTSFETGEQEYHDPAGRATLGAALEALSLNSCREQGREGTQQHQAPHQDDQQRRTGSDDPIMDNLCERAWNVLQSPPITNFATVFGVVMVPGKDIYRTHLIRRTTSNSAGLEVLELLELCKCGINMAPKDFKLSMEKFQENMEDRYRKSTLAKKPQADGASRRGKNTVSRLEKFSEEIKTTKPNRNIISNMFKVYFEVESSQEFC